MSNQKVESTNVTGGKESTNLTADTLIKSGPGDLIGIFVASQSAASVKVWDSLTAATTVLVNTTTLYAGWNSMPFPFKTGLYIDITGTIDLTVSWS